MYMSYMNLYGKLSACGISGRSNNTIELVCGVGKSQGNSPVTGSLLYYTTCRTPCRANIVLVHPIRAKPLSVHDNRNLRYMLVIVIVLATQACSDSSTAGLIPSEASFFFSFLSPLFSFLLLFLLLLMLAPPLMSSNIILVNNS